MLKPVTLGIPRRSALADHLSCGGVPSDSHDRRRSSGRRCSTIVTRLTTRGANGEECTARRHGSRKGPKRNWQAFTSRYPWPLNEVAVTRLVEGSKVAKSKPMRSARSDDVAKTIKASGLVLANGTLLDIAHDASVAMATSKAPAAVRGRVQCFAIASHAMLEAADRIQ
jgi:hypothetical protein